MSGLSLDLTTSPPEKSDSSTGSDNRGPPPSVFGIIVVGLLTGLVVGLLIGPSFTLQGFFLGFAGGALATAGLYFYTSDRRRPAR